METIDLKHENESDVKAITDTDFIENYIPSYKDLYNLVYGIFYLSDEEYPFEEESIYNLIVSLCIDLKTKSWRRLRCVRFINEITNVITKLKEYKFQYGNIYIVIPFVRLYKQTIEFTIQKFDFALSVLKELYNSDFIDLELLELDNKVYPIPTISELFDELLDSVNQGNFDYLTCDSQYIVLDEMYRRGLSLNHSNKLDQNLYRDYFIGEFLNLNLMNIKEVIVDDDTIKISITDKKRVGVLYYMLKDVLDEDLLISVISYVINKDYNKKKKANSSVYKYLHNISLLIDKQDNIDYIKSQLERYDIEVPKELK